MSTTIATPHSGKLVLTNDGLSSVNFGLEARFNNLFVLAAISLNNTNTTNSTIPNSIPQPFCGD